MSDSFFYAPSLNGTDATVTLTGDEARHASGARRLRTGDRATLFNGRGLTASAVLLATRDRGRSMEFRVLDRRHQPRPRPAVHLACALPKGDRLSTLLDMGTQLSMDSFTPLTCEHSVVRPGAVAVDRWWRICLEACKQSRRAWLPDILPGTDPVSVTRAAVAAGAAAWIAHPDGPSPVEGLRNIRGDHWFLVGPEGGFTDDEITAAEAQGARRVGLGKGILRIETAALVMLSAARLCALSG